MRWTIPNILTAARIIAAPAVALAFVTIDRPAADWIAFILFAAASFTDYLDGWLARKLNMTSEVGKMLDPIADKAMVIIALAVLVARQPTPVLHIDGVAYFHWDPIATLILIPGAIIILREVMVSGLREYLGDVKLPDLPEVNERGRRPARETSRAVLARKLIKRRVTAGWTQAELAERAGVRVETISRLEGGKHRPHPSTIVKLDAAFEQVGA